MDTELTYEQRRMLAIEQLILVCSTKGCLHDSDLMDAADAWTTDPTWSELGWEATERSDWDRLVEDLWLCVTEATA